jgi:hypothetical protein
MQLHDPCKTNQIPTKPRRSSEGQPVMHTLIGHGLVNAYPVSDPSEKSQPALAAQRSG